VLASASPRRLALLAQAGIVPERVLAANVDERPLKAEPPRIHAERLAAVKARVIWSKIGSEHVLVLAADTVVALGRRILPKASSDADVRECLAALSGRRHIVMTAVAVAYSPGHVHVRTVLTRIAFKRLSETEIESYIRIREGIGKAGGYGLQGRAETFVRLINGSWSNVVGLPLAETVGLLRGHGLKC